MTWKFDCWLFGTSFGVFLNKIKVEFDFQGNRVLENFNIVEAAGGIGVAIIKEFNVKVIGGSLEVRLYWAGKGTTGLASRGHYGPLISAISVTNGTPQVDTHLLFFL